MPMWSMFDALHLMPVTAAVFHSGCVLSSSYPSIPPSLSLSLRHWQISAAADRPASINLAIQVLLHERLSIPLQVRGRRPSWRLSQLQITSHYYDSIYHYFCRSCQQGEWGGQQLRIFSAVQRMLPEPKKKSFNRETEAKSYILEQNLPNDA